MATSEYKPEYCGSALDGNIKQNEFCARKHSMNESNIVISFDKGDVSLLFIRHFTSVSIKTWASLKDCIY